jgi:hypothetical protein
LWSNCGKNLNKSGFMKVKNIFFQLSTKVSKKWKSYPQFEIGKLYFYVFFIVDFVDKKNKNNLY